MMQNPAIKYGIIGGLLAILYTLVVYMIDVSLLANNMVGMIMFIPYIVLMVLAARDAKRQNQEAAFSFAKAFVPPFITLLIIFVISYLFMALMYKVIDPELEELVKKVSVENTIEWMESFGSSEEDIDKAVERTKNQEIVSFMSFIGGLIGFAFFSLIISLIIAAIFYEKKKQNSALDAN